MSTPKESPELLVGHKSLESLSGLQSDTGRETDEFPDVMTNEGRRGTKLNVGIGGTSEE